MLCDRLEDVGDGQSPGNDNVLGSGDISGNGGFDDGTCNRGEYGNNVGARGIGNDGNAGGWQCT